MATYTMTKYEKTRSIDFQNKLQQILKLKKKLEEIIKNLLKAEEDFKIPSENQELKENQWENVKDLRKEATKFYDKMSREMDILKNWDKNTEKERDKIYAKKPELRPKTTTYIDPVKYSIPELPHFDYKEELIRKGKVEHIRKDIKNSFAAGGIDRFEQHIQKRLKHFLQHFRSQKERFTKIIDKYLSEAEEAFRIPNENQELKDDQWKTVEDFQEKAKNINYDLQSVIEKIEEYDEIVEEERDKVYADRPDLRPPKITSYLDPEIYSVPGLQDFNWKEKLIEEGKNEQALREKVSKMSAHELKKFEDERNEDWDNIIYLLKSTTKELKDLLYKQLPKAEEDFKIPHENQKLKDDEWERVEALRNEVQKIYDGSVRYLKFFKKNEKELERERDAVYADRPDLRPPRISSLLKPENYVIPTLPIFQPKGKLIEEGITELAEKTLADRSIKTIELEVENIKNLFGNNDRETDYYQTELIRLKRLICSTDDKVERHDYYKEYKNALKSLIALLYKNQELLNESSEFLHEIQDFSNTSGLSFETEQQEISTILNEHAS